MYCKQSRDVYFVSIYVHTYIKLEYARDVLNSYYGWPLNIFRNNNSVVCKYNFSL